MAGYLVLAELIARWNGFYRQAHEAAIQAHLPALDGLRGFLALAVFFHHAVISYFAYRTGTWAPPPSHFYALLGPVAVAFFFMITGFLFWSKAIRAGGRVQPLRLYTNRVRRLAPLYLFSVVGVLMVGAYLSGGDTHLSLWHSFTGLVRVLALGGLRWWPLFGMELGRINASVTWTLRYEWLFYLALPLVALLATPRRFVLAAVLAVGLAWFEFPWIYFLGGAAAAHLAQWPAAQRWARRRRLTPLYLAPLAALFVLPPGPNWLTPCLLWPAFLAIALGNDLLGLLRTRGAMCLGTVSYSTYLMHGIVLFCGLKLVNHACGIEGWSAGSYWLLCGVLGVVVVLLSCATYRWIEHPFLVRKAAAPAAAAMAGAGAV